AGCRRSEWPVRGRCAARRTPSGRRRTSRIRPRCETRAGAPCSCRCRGGAAPRYGNPIMSTDSTAAPMVPDKPTIDGLEARWGPVWEDEGTYRFNPAATRDQVFSIDTPPPTVSGSLHMGSVFGYVQTDALARFQRMRGREVFYPMGWDDNGLATERRVQNYYGVRCDPHLAYDPSFRLPDEPPKDPIAISRPNFLELCAQLVVQDEQAFEALWRALGLS